MAAVAAPRLRSGASVGAGTTVTSTQAAKAHAPAWFGKKASPEDFSHNSAIKAQNVREDPTLYPKMSVLKVGFYRELLSFGFNVWACDADAIFMNDPRPLMRQGAWAHADVAIATDCIDLPSDARYPLLHCDFNTGLVFLRASPTMSCVWSHDAPPGAYRAAAV